ncbi:cytochrome P450 [Nonomuraea sp. NPDC050328]|uniref:cytochrome P450 n=1 Tax=Nonomuraea sp. NPDC050328 TaxID=3364361 RepID=UPI0037B8320A
MTAGKTFLERYGEAVRDDPLRALAMVQGWMRTDWRAFFAELRTERPIFATPAFTVVTRYADVAEVLSLERVFSVRAFAPRLDAALGGAFMLARDATPMNWREKGLMRALLVPEDATAVRELAGRLAEEALDAAEARSGAEPRVRVEAVQEVFRHVALRICADYFGLPGPTPETLGGWTRAIILDGFANYHGDPAVRAASERAGAELMAYLAGLLAERRNALADGERDILSRLLRTSLPAELGLDEQRLMINMAGLPLGWVESGPGAMAEALEQLFEHPEALAAAGEVAGEPERFDPYVWEALRFSPFFKLLPRLCERDHLLAAGTSRETVIKAGTFVLAAPASAMFDAHAVPDPEEFRLDRPEHLRLFFGLGHHSCLGVHPAGAVICEVVRRMVLRPGLSRLPAPEGDVIRVGAVFPDRFTLTYDRQEARR